MSANYKPSTHPQIVPYLVLSDADKALDFVKKVFGAIEMRISRDQRGQIGHGEVRIGDSVLMIGQASEQWPSSPAAIYVYVPDVDAAYQRALEANAESMWQPVNQPYGDRNGGVKDSNGVQWWMATHLEEVSEEEEARRRAAKESAPAPA